MCDEYRVRLHRVYFHLSHNMHETKIAVFVKDVKVRFCPQVDMKITIAKDDTFEVNSIAQYYNRASLQVYQNLYLHQYYVKESVEILNDKVIPDLEKKGWFLDECLYT